MSALTRIANALEAASHAPAAAQKSYLLASLAGVTVTSMILQKSIAKTGRKYRILACSAPKETLAYSAHAGYMSARCTKAALSLPPTFHAASAKLRQKKALEAQLAKAVKKH